MNKKATLACVSGIFIIIIISIIIGIVYLIVNSDSTKPDSQAAIEMKKFTSEEDFRDFLKSQAESQYYGLETGGTIGDLQLSQEIDFEAAPEGLGDGLTLDSSRVSKTNVQERNIDEPDIVKTDGENIYISVEASYYVQPQVSTEIDILENSQENETSSSEQFQPKSKTDIVNAFPPSSLSKISSIDEQGNLLLHEDVLAILSYDSANIYDISDPESPEKLWDLELDEDTYIKDTRLYNGKIYLITSTQIYQNSPCIMHPLTINENDIAIQCTDIYHPIVDSNIDVTFTVLKLNPTNGMIEDRISFVGSSNSSVIYMSTNSLYITYADYMDSYELIYDFVTTKAQDIIPENTLTKLTKLQEYDLSNEAKLVELETILTGWQNSLSSEKQEDIEEQLAELYESYQDENKRDFSKTGIVKIGIDDFNIDATGSVPGQPLNQFSLDEHADHLRIATTIGTSSWNTQGSANDVYILDSNLRQTGSVIDLGLDERIYSVRFIGDEGYVVTFEQIDPFYVIDLSDPTNPQLKGELKIPGFSSYLHPIDSDTILGIGEEDWQVKISLFDVSDPDNPTEKDKYILDDQWSEVSSTHHAFLLDSKHNVFFLPGSSSGYIFSYDQNKLVKKKEVEIQSARRAIYIDDYMYIIGDSGIIILDESNWDEVGSLSL